MCLLNLVTLTISLAFVCDGFRSVDQTVGARIALLGVAGAVATMLYRSVFGYRGMARMLIRKAGRVSLGLGSLAHIVLHI